MTSAIVTTSYAPDFERFARLHASVLEHSDLPHYVVVPEGDRALFAPVAKSGRLVVLTERDVLPRNIVTTEWFSRAVARIPHAPGALRWAAINTRRPWPPIRGWVLQQLVKLAAPDYVDADTLISIDSEIQLVRPVTDTTFRRGDVTRLYRRPGGITESMARHRKWHAVANRVIGAATSEIPPFDDFIAGIVSWDAAVVRSCTSRIDELGGGPWSTTLGGELDISEYVLYGEYISQFGTAEQQSFASDRTLCHSYWDAAPLDLAAARLFVESMSDDDVAVHIQSNSHTPGDVEKYILDAVRAN